MTSADAASAAAPSLSSSSSVPVGIDLGHSYAVIGVWRNGNVDVIANDLGNRSTPVLLSFTEKEVLFGEAAQSQLAVNLRATVHHAKRILGLPYQHPAVAELLERVDYSIVPSDGEGSPSSSPLIQLSHKGEETRLRSEELLSLMLSRLKGIADRYTSSDCKECVLAVPSFFSPAQRAALVAAGTQAGLSVLTVLNEATAACLAFKLDLPPDPPKPQKPKQLILVIDVGGATTTISILQSELGLLTLRSCAYDLHLGGDDFDAVLVKHFSSEFRRSTNLELSSSHRALARLSFAVEKAKRVLSSSSSASIELDGLYEGEDLYSKISRAKFETLANPLFKRMQALIQSTLATANLHSAMVDHVCLIGGSSRIPRVREIVRGVLGKDVMGGVNPEEAVAIGCTIQASVLLGRGKEWEGVAHGEEGEKRGELALGGSLGVEGDDGIVQRVLSKGTTVPTHATFSLAPHRTRPAASSALLLRVYEGERAKATDNHLLATLLLPASTPTPLTASFTVDKQRKLHIRAYSGKTVHGELTIDPALPHCTTPPTAATSLDSLYLTKSSSRRLLYDYLLTLHEPRSLVDATWAWLESTDVQDGEDDQFAHKQAELEQAVDQWKEQQKHHHPHHHAVDMDDVDDYVANLSLNGHTTGGTSANGSGAAEEFEHEIADLD